MMAYDLKRVSELLDKYPNSDVEVSARIQDLGRQPYSGRAFLLKYQDRVLFGTDGNPGREVEQFWTPHWRYFETDDEYFNHPAQMLSPLGRAAARPLGDLRRVSARRSDPQDLLPERAEVSAGGPGVDSAATQGARHDIA